MWTDTCHASGVEIVTDEFQDAMIHTLIAAIATMLLGCGAAFSQIRTGAPVPWYNLAAWHNNCFAGPIGRHSPRYHGTRVARTQFGALKMDANKVE
jgi:hypothetical protein